MSEFDNVGLMLDDARGKIGLLSGDAQAALAALQKIGDEDTQPTDSQHYSNYLSEAYIPDYNSSLEDGNGFPICIYPFTEYFYFPIVMTSCQKCKLDGDKNQPILPSIVTSRTSMNAPEQIDLVIITEAPSMVDVEQGVPGADDAGRMMFSMITQMWTPDTMPGILLGTTVLCHAKDNKVPSMAIYRNCGGNFWPIALADTELIKDNALIVVVGSTPNKFIHDIADNKPTASSILSCHGMTKEMSFTHEGVTRTFPVYMALHPAIAIHAPDKLVEVAKDFEGMYTIYNRKLNLTEGETLIKEKSDNEIDLDKDLVIKEYSEQLTPPELNHMVSTIVALYADIDDKVVSYDVESKGKDTNDPSNTIRLAGFGAIGGHTWQFTDKGLCSIGDIFLALKENGIKVVGHNLWFDLIMSWKARYFSSVDNLPDHRDTRVMQKLVDENMPDNKLKFLCTKYFGIDDWEADLHKFADAEGNIDYWLLPMKDLKKYHRGDLYWTLALYYHLTGLIAGEEVSGYWTIDYVDFKHRANAELLRASIEGFKLDKNIMASNIDEYESKMDEVVEWFKQPLYQRVIASMRQMDRDFKTAVLQSLSGFPLVEQFDAKKDVFNPNSTDQVIALLASVLDDPSKLIVMKALGRKAKTASKKMSLNADNLDTIINLMLENPVFNRKYSHLVEGMQKVGEFRKLKKIAGTYLYGMIKNMWSDGVVRSQWNVDGAATGRLSSSRPNLQQIPKGKTARTIKTMFVPKGKDWVLMQFDLSQAELRGLGTFTEDPNLKRAYDNDMDLHSYTASNIFGIPVEDIEDSERSVAKTINFAVVYGANASTIAATASISLAEAQSALDGWFEFYSGVKPWMGERADEVDNQGYVVGAWGLKRRLPAHLSNESELADLKRQAGNFVIQNFASDFNVFIILHMMNIIRDNNLQGYCVLVNTVHDSIVFEVHPDYVDWVAWAYYTAIGEVNTMCREMFAESYIEMVGDMEVGFKNWGDMQKAGMDSEGRVIISE